MSEPIEESYFNWLCAKVRDPYATIYLDLLRILHRTEFVWVLPYDENRAMDGMDLRSYFVTETGLDPDPNWSHTPCSVLEMLLGLANQLEFLTDTPTREWFWTFMTNLKLDEYRQVSDEDLPVIEDILYAFVWRTYAYDGRGGIFPLRWPKRNQREHEIWHQLGDYLEEQEH